MKKRLIFLLCFSVSLLINIIPLFVFKEKAAFKDYSLYSLLLMIGMSIMGVYEYADQSGDSPIITKYHYIPGMSRLFGKSSEEEDEQAFFWQFTVYYATIPFYIPCIFFCTKLENLGWPFLVFIAPQIIYISYFIIVILIDVKKDKRIKQKHEQELKEQQKREEMGHFK